MKPKFVVAPELQEFLSGLESPALDNVLFDFPHTEDSQLPANPDATRRILFFSKGGYSEDATPNPIEYNCYREDLRATTVDQITFPRGI